MTERSHVSLVIRERALAMIRETRAKIDPRLLAAMKEKLSSLVVEPAHEKKVTAQKVIPQVMEKKAPSSVDEPIDKEKIAQIVLQYMKNKKENRPN